MTRIDAINNRTKVLDAAREVFGEQGLGAEVKAIAQQAGVGVGTLYRSFPRKDDLILELLREKISHYNTLLQEAEAQDNPIAGLRILLAGTFTIHSEYWFLVEPMVTRQLSPELLKEFEGQAGIWPARALLRRAINLGYLRPDLDVETAAAMISGTMLPWIERQLKNSHDPVTLANNIVDLFLMGAAAEKGAQVLSVR